MIGFNPKLLARLIGKKNGCQPVWYRFLLGFFQWSQFHSFVEAFVQSSNQGRQAAMNVSLMASSRQWLVAAVRNPVEVTPNIPKCWFSKGTHPKMALNQGKDL